MSTTRDSNRGRTRRLVTGLGVVFVTAVLVGAALPAGAGVLLSESDELSSVEPEEPNTDVPSAYDATSESSDPPEPDSSATDTAAPPGHEPAPIPGSEGEETGPETAEALPDDAPTGTNTAPPDTEPDFADSQRDRAERAGASQRDEARTAPADEPGPAAEPKAEDPRSSEQRDDVGHDGPGQVADVGGADAARSAVGGADDETVDIIKLGVQTGFGADFANVAPLGGADFATSLASGSTAPDGTLSLAVAEGDTLTETSAPMGWSAIDAFGIGDYESPQEALKYNPRPVEPGASERFVNRAVNPPVARACGLRIVLLVDRSGSVSSNQDDVDAAAQALINSLAGTPSELSVASFSDTATAPSQFYSMLHEDQRASALSEVAGLAYAGGTDTARGLWAVAESISNLAEPVDLVLMATDGNPTLAFGGNDTSHVSREEMEFAVASANAVKLRTHLAIVGIELDGLSESNLVAMSGPDKDNLGAVGDYYTADFGQLADLLASIAGITCNGSVTVVKEVPDGQGSWKPWVAVGDPFEFSASPEDALESINPQLTDDSGAVNFKWMIPAQSSLSGVEITEGEKPGWEPDSGFCDDDFASSFDSASGTLALDEPVPSSGVVVCHVRNVRSGEPGEVPPPRNPTPTTQPPVVSPTTLDPVTTPTTLDPVATPTTSPALASPTTAVAAKTTTAPATLPFTGGRPANLVVLGLTMLGAGTVLIVSRRRRANSVVGRR